MRMPVRPLRQLVPSTSQVAQDDERRRKKVSFAAKIQCRAIPSENKGRKCRGQARKKLEGRWEKPSVSAGGAIPTSQAATPTPRPRWADICEEEDEKERSARAAAAAGASGKSESAVDYVGAKAADTKAGEARELRGIHSVSQSFTETCTGYNEQSANFRVDSRSFRAVCRRGSSRFSGSPRALAGWHYALLKY